MTINVRGVLTIAAIAAGLLLLGGLAMLFIGPN